MLTSTRTLVFSSSLATLLLAGCSHAAEPMKALVSIETGHTVSNVRTATGPNGEYIVASTYDGIVLGYSFDGKKLWENALSGFMNHDLWCDDVTGDDVDECFAANADGNLYAINSKGKNLWSFKKSETPLSAVTVVRDKNNTHIVVGSYDKNIYYLDSRGALTKTLDSSTYGIEKTHAQAGKKFPKAKYHVANFLRPMSQADGTDKLFLHATNNHMMGNGTYYIFEPLADKPSKTIKGKTRVVGDINILEEDGVATGDVLVGNSNVIKNSVTGVLNIETGVQKNVKVRTLDKELDTFGYRVVQPLMIEDQGQAKRLVLFGSQIALMSPPGGNEVSEIISSKYSYNDIWQDKASGRLILASEQSGGSAIHVLAPSEPGWKEAFSTLKPSETLADVISGTAKIAQLVKSHEPETADLTGRQVIFATENKRGVEPIIKRLEKASDNPIFLNNVGLGSAEAYDRSFVTNKKYRDRRDGRRKYNGKQENYIRKVKKQARGAPGVAMWGGHGNDPLMFTMDTKRKIIDVANGKKVIMIFPEMADPNDDFNYVMDNMIYPLAEYGKGKNFNFHVRSKHAFWQADIHMPRWSRLISGEFADVFVPSMEETTDKSMELSLSGRMGIWAAGSVNEWAARSARDNPSYSRLRQHAHQMVPNHFLRQQVYAIASGATQLDNSSIDQEYASVLWEMISKGVLYAPERNQIVSLNPVHLSMIAPDPLYLRDSQNVKWNTFYDLAEEADNPRVFSRMSGSWPGAQVTEWDFSRYAANETERRHNFIPQYPNGMVLITPTQDGAEKDPRGLLDDNLHPIYKGRLTEFISDGRDYISSDGKTRYGADTHYTKVADAIKASADVLPVTVSGDVGWIVTEIEPKRLRLTLIDGGYLNPAERQTVVKFGASSPVSVRDVLTGETSKVSKGDEITFNIPPGLFRFIDIELERPLIEEPR